MENYCDYVPTPERIEASRRLDEERKERCKRINERYGIYEEVYDQQNNSRAEDANVVELKGDNKASLPTLPSNRRDVKKPKSKKKPIRHKENNNTSHKNDGQSSLF